MAGRGEWQRKAPWCLRGMRGDESPLKLENFLVHFPQKELKMVIWGYRKWPTIHQHRIRSEDPIITVKAGFLWANIMIDDHLGLKQGQLKLVKMTGLWCGPFRVVPLKEALLTIFVRKAPRDPLRSLSQLSVNDTVLLTTSSEGKARATDHWNLSRCWFLFAS